MLADSRAWGCTGMLTHAHVLHVLGFGFDSREASRVMVRTCECTGCTGMLAAPIRSVLVISIRTNSNRGSRIPETMLILTSEGPLRAQISQGLGARLSLSSSPKSARCASRRSTPGQSGCVGKAVAPRSDKWSANTHGVCCTTIARLRGAHEPLSRRAPRTVLGRAFGGAGCGKQLLLLVVSCLMYRLSTQ